MFLKRTSRDSGTIQCWIFIDLVGMCVLFWSRTSTRWTQWSAWGLATLGFFAWAVNTYRPTTISNVTQTKQSIGNIIRRGAFILSAYSIRYNRMCISICTHAVMYYNGSLLHCFRISKNVIAAKLAFFFFIKFI